VQVSNLEGHPPGPVQNQDLQDGGFTKFVETCAPLLLGYLVSDVIVIVELFERDVNTSWTRAFDFIEKFLLGWLWLGIPSISIVC